MECLLAFLDSVMGSWPMGSINQGAAAEVRILDPGHTGIFVGYPGETNKRRGATFAQAQNKPEGPSTPAA